MQPDWVEAKMSAQITRVGGRERGREIGKNVFDGKKQNERMRELQSSGWGEVERSGELERSERQKEERERERRPSWIRCSSEKAAFAFEIDRLAAQFAASGTTAKIKRSLRRPGERHSLLASLRRCAAALSRVRTPGPLHA